VVSNGGVIAFVEDEQFVCGPLGTLRDVQELRICVVYDALLDFAILGNPREVGVALAQYHLLPAPDARRAFGHGKDVSLVDDDLGLPGSAPRSSEAIMS